MEEQGAETTVNKRMLHLGDNERHKAHLLYLPKRKCSRSIREGYERVKVETGEKDLSPLTDQNLQYMTFAAPGEVIVNLS